MSSYDLLDIYEILIQIRFSIDANGSQQLITLLLEALHLQLWKLLHNENIEYKFIREYILNNYEREGVKLGTFDENFPTDDIVLKDTNVIFSFCIVVSAIRKKILNKEYKEAFSLVDKFHNYPIIYDYCYIHNSNLLIFLLSFYNK